MENAKMENAKIDFIKQLSNDQSTQKQAVANTVNNSIDSGSGKDNMRNIFENIFSTAHNIASSIKNDDVTGCDKDEMRNTFAKIQDLVSKMESNPVIQDLASTINDFNTPCVEKNEQCKRLPENDQPQVDTNTNEQCKQPQVDTNTNEQCKQSLENTMTNERYKHLSEYAIRNLFNDQNLMSTLLDPAGIQVEKGDEKGDRENSFMNPNLFSKLCETMSGIVESPVIRETVTTLAELPEFKEIAAALLESLESARVQVKTEKEPQCPAEQCNSNNKSTCPEPYIDGISPETDGIRVCEVNSHNTNETNETNELNEIEKNNETKKTYKRLLQIAELYDDPHSQPIDYVTLSKQDVHDCTTWEIYEHLADELFIDIPTFDNTKFDHTQYTAPNQLLANFLRANCYLSLGPASYASLYKEHVTQKAKNESRIFEIVDVD